MNWHHGLCTVGAVCTPHVLQQSKDHPKKQLQNGVATAPRHWEEEDSIHQLDRAAQVTIFRLRTGHCQLLSHLHRLKISHTDECPCGTGPQTPNHILQSYPTFDDLRRQTWPSPVETHRKLWGLVETLRQTADFALLTGLKNKHGQEWRRRRRTLHSVTAKKQNRWSTTSFRTVPSETTVMAAG